MLHVMNMSKLAQIKERLNQSREGLQANDRQFIFINEIILDLKELENSINNYDNYEGSEDARHQKNTDMQTKYVAAIQKIINKINQNVSQFPDINLRFTFYRLVLVLTKAGPFNKREYIGKSYVPHWICPLTLENYSIHNDAGIALTSGYLYNREALIKWFETSPRYIDPMTRQPLPDFDINRIMKLSKGLKQRQKIEKDHLDIRDNLIKQQTIKLQSSLSPSDQIKQDFLALTALTADKTLQLSNKYHYSQLGEDKAKLTARLHENMQKIGIVQREPKSNNIGDIQGNFSNIDLHDVHFYNNQLMGPFANSRIDLRGANLSGCIFFHESLQNKCVHADFTDANLANARFVNLSGAGACLKTTDFTRANLQNVDFTGISNWSAVNVTDANLVGAYLYNKKNLCITGEKLKKYLDKNFVEGVDSAHFTEISGNRNASIQSNISPQKTTLLTSPVPSNPVCPVKQKKQSLIQRLHNAKDRHKFGLFENTQRGNEQEQINFLKQQNEQLKKQNQLLMQQKLSFAHCVDNEEDHDTPCFMM